MMMSRLVTLAVGRGIAFAFLLSSILLMLPSNALACRQNPGWCRCIDACQNAYWKCRQDASAMWYSCIVDLDACQIRCDESTPKNPSPVDPGRDVVASLSLLF